MKLKKRYALTGVSFTLPFLAGFALLYLIPFLWSIQKTFTAGAGGIRFAGLQNYADLFRSAAFRLAAGNTFRFIAVGVPLLMALSFLLALALYRKFRGASFFRSAFLMPMVIPVAATITVVRAFFGDSGLTNQLLELLGLPIQDFMGSELAFPVLVGLYIWKNCGYNIVLFLAGLSAIPLYADEEDGQLCMEQLLAEDHTEDFISDMDTLQLLHTLKAQYSGTVKFGIEAIEWKVKGLTGKEIADMYGVKPNLVGAWISRAASRLKQNPVFLQAFADRVEKQPQ